MKKAEVKRVLVREWRELRAADGSLVASGEDGDFGFVDASERVVRVRRYRLEQPVVQEVRTPGGETYETEYRIVDGNQAGRVVAGVSCSGWRTWEVWAEREDSAVHDLEFDGRVGYAAAERYARRMLCEAGYRVKRAKP